MKKQMFDLGIRADHFLSMAGGEAKPLRNIFLGVKGGEIAEVAPFRASHAKACRKFIEAKGQVLLPGFVNGHTHLPMTLLRGVTDDVSFHEWLFSRILPLEARLVSREFVRDGIWLAALECIRFGVTTVNEMYFFAEEEAKVLDAAGLRAIISQTIASFPLPEDSAVGKDKFSIVAKLRKKYEGHERIRIGYGPHAPYSCEDGLLKMVEEASRLNGAPVHIHVSETEKEVKESREKHGITPVERLDRLSLLRRGTICAHCVHLDEKDQQIFARSGASMVYNPDSNAKLGSGLARIGEYLDRAIPVSLGTDGAASNNDLSIFGAMDMGCKLQKLAAGERAARFGAREALSAATWGGARALGLGDITGSLEVGKRADFVLLDLRFPHLQPVNDLVSQIVYAAQGMEVSLTACDGQILFHKGRFTAANADRIYARAEAWRKKLGSALSKA